jgi:fatty acid desaturase
MSNLRFCREKENKSSPAGITFTGLLQVAFIVLKLCNVINWSWWWVLAPTWIPIGLAAMIVAVAFIIAVVKDE